MNAQTTEAALQEYVACLETRLAERGYAVQEVVNYLAGVNDQERQRCEQAAALEMLMIFGGDTFAGFQRVGAAYFAELLPRGVKTILITGGIGRLTAQIVNDARTRSQQGLLSTMTVRKEADREFLTFATTGQFLAQTIIKSLQTGAFDLQAAKEAILPYVTEGDVYLEWLLNLFRERGYRAGELAIFGYADYQWADGKLVIDQAKTDALRQAEAIEPESHIYRFRPESRARLVRAQQQGQICIFVENASTHTGTNVRYALEMLLTAGYIATRADAERLAQRTLAYQQPVLQLRSKYTVGKRFGRLPLSFSYAP